nr:unnamed protein product [Spirometra erinaceieuropaei]
MARYKVGIAALNKTWFPGQGQLKQDVSDRLISLHLPPRGVKSPILIGAYVSLMTNSDETKTKFYEDLHPLLVSVPKANKLVVLGDFSTRVGMDYAVWRGVLCPHGIVGCNDNDHLLLQSDLLLLSPHRTAEAGGDCGRLDYS